jgi:hypothetical protein
MNLLGRHWLVRKIKVTLKNTEQRALRMRENEKKVEVTW